MQYRNFGLGLLVSVCSANASLSCSGAAPDEQQSGKLEQAVTTYESAKADLDATNRSPGTCSGGWIYYFPAMKIVDYQKVPATPPPTTGWQWELTNRSVTIEQEARLDIRHEINPEAKQLWPFHKRLSRRSTVIDPQDLSFRVASAPTREGDIFKMLEFARGTEVPGRESWWKKADRTYTIEIPLEFDGSSVCKLIGEEYLKIWKDYVRAGMVQTPTVRAHDADSMTVTAEFKGAQNHRPSLESSRLIYTAEFNCAIAIANVPVWKFTESTTTHDPKDVPDPNAPIYEAFSGNYEGLPPALRPEMSFSPPGLTLEGMKSHIRKRVQDRGLNVRNLQSYLDALNENTYDDAASLNAFGHPPPVCTSCDTIDIRTEEGLRRRFNCYATRGSVEHRRYMKLLAEVRGEDLTQKQRDEVAILYELSADTYASDQTRVDELREAHTQSVNLVRRIGGHSMSHPHRAAQSNLRNLFGTFQYCDALLDHGSVKSMKASLHSCLQSFESMEQEYRSVLDPQGAIEDKIFRDKDKPNLSEWYKRFVLRYFEQSDSVMEGMATVADLGRNLSAVRDEIRVRLRALSSWYGSSGVRDRLRAARTLPEAERVREIAALENKIGEILGAFWRSLYPNTEGKAESVIQALGGGLILEREALAIAYESGEANSVRVPDELLPMFTADAFRGALARLESFSSTHDLACRYSSRKCGRDGASSTAAEMWGLIASLNDTEELRRRVDSATQLERNSSTKPWRDAMKAVLQNHTYLKKGIQSLLGRDQGAAWEPRAVLTPEALGYSSLAEFSRLIAKARDASRRFERSGFFELVENKLEERLTPAGREAASAELRRKKEALDNERTRYLTNQESLIVTEQGNLGNERNKNAIRTRLAAIAQKFDDLTLDINGLQEGQAIEQARFADIAATYNERLSEETNQANYHFQRVPRQHYTVSARQAGQELHSFRVVSGEWVNFQINGMWAPTCSLRDPSFKFPDGSRPTADELASLNTGPEGFSRSYSNQKFSAKNKQTGKSVNNYITHEESSSRCQTSGMDFGLNVSGIANSAGAAGAAAGAASGVGPAFAVGGALTGGLTRGDVQEDCIRDASGTTKSDFVNDTADEGSDVRHIAALSGGLRAPASPFVYYPTGSLLLVSRQPGKQGLAVSNLNDVRVLQAPASSVYFNEPADVFFLVNDSAACGANADPSNLTILMDRLTPSAALLKDFSSHVAKVFEFLQGERKRIVAQGQMLATDGANLQSQAHDKLLALCRCKMIDYPPFVQQFFATWVGAEVNEMERRTAVLSKERERRQLVIETRSLETDLVSVDTQSHYQTQLRHLALRNLDATQMHLTMRDLATYAAQVVFPTLRLRYPQLLTRVMDDAVVKQSVQAILDADWSAPFVGVGSSNVAQHQVNLAAGILRHIPPVQNNEATLASYTAVLRIPLYKDVRDPQYPNPCEPVDRAGVPTSWQSMSCGKSRSIWADLLDEHKEEVTFEVEPSDLYRRDRTSITAALSCSVAAPVIKQMLLYFGNDNQVLSGNHNKVREELDTTFGETMFFPTADGPEKYSFNGRTNNTLIALFGTSIDALPTLDTQQTNGHKVQELSRYAGVSPFTRYTINVEGLRHLYGDPLRTSYELLLVYYLEAVDNQARRLPSVPQCNPPVGSVRPVGVAVQSPASVDIAQPAAADVVPVAQTVGEPEAGL